MGKRTGESILGVAGGILGVFVGIFIYYLGTFGMGDISAESAGLLLMLLGVLGLVGGVIVGRFRSTGGAFMLIAGILGFFILFALWIVPGIILIIGGILTFKKPRVLREVKVEGGGGYV
jgi:hypothetical protein